MLMWEAAFGLLRSDITTTMGTPNSTLITSVMSFARKDALGGGIDSDESLLQIRLRILRTCMAEIEQACSRVIWQAVRLNDKRRVVSEFETDLQRCWLPLGGRYCDVAGLAVDLISVRRWDDGDGAWETLAAADYTRRPEAVITSRAGRFEITADIEPEVSAGGTTVPPDECMEAVGRLFAYRDRVRAAEMLGDEMQRTAAGALKYSGAYDILLAWRGNSMAAMA